MRNRLPALAAIALAVAVTAGCASSSDRPLKITLAALNVRAPAGPASAPAGPAPAPACHDVTASLRPPAVLPKPGAMPKGSFMARIEAHRYLIAGVDQSTLLFANFNPMHSRIEGFEIDLLRQVARAIFGNPEAIHLRAITPAERIPVVQDGGVDLVADAVTINCARRQQVDFSTAYFDARQRLLVPSNSTAHDFAGLGRRPICAAVGSTTLQTLQSLHPRPVTYPVPERIDCLVALQQGLVGAISSDDSILLGYKAQDPYTKIIGAPLAKEPYGIAINKAHPEFVRFVNGVLARMRADGTWRRIYNRWFGRLTAIPVTPTARYER
ncbi:MAG TPA: glutamate ABC transporter substrate-binding protein [Solirubrobacteraceae bacterium]